MKQTLLAIAIAAALPAQAVRLDADGLGQALVFPYYTVNAAPDGNPHHTYLSIVNHTRDAKALRVRVREARAAREVADFNLYLGPNDVWTAAFVPSGEGASLVTQDTSCTEPAFTRANGTTALELRGTAYAGDGFGAGLDRTREGYVEVFEMATLTGAASAAVSHLANGTPQNCDLVRNGTQLVAAPSGGLSGTLTLINVAAGRDFTLDAVALADLATRPYFRGSASAFAGFASAEIDAVSMIAANGQLYRSVWARPQDAVSAVLMRSTWMGEYTLDRSTLSRTDFVVTMPTRPHYLDGTQYTAPFLHSASWAANCGDRGARLSAVYFNREERGAMSSGSDFPELPSALFHGLCGAASVGAVMEPASPALPSPFSLLGSRALGLFDASRLIVTNGFQNGWIHLRPTTPGTLTSLASSTRTDMATGVVTTGAHVHAGLPIVGFWVRTFDNGTLACSGGSCQGNYGGAFPFRYLRAITPAN